MPGASGGNMEDNGNVRYSLRDNRNNSQGHRHQPYEKVLPKSLSQNVSSITPPATNSLCQDSQPSSNNTDGNFIEPPPKKQRKKGRSTSVTSPRSFESKNKFSELADETDMDAESISSERSSTVRLRKAQVKKADPKPHPIVISNVSNTVVQQLLNLSGLKTKGCYMKKGENYQIHAGSVEDKKLLITHLQDKQFVYHTYSEKSERKAVYVLKNHFFIEPDVLLVKLIANNIPASKVSFLNRNINNPSYLVQFEKDAIAFHLLNSIHNKVDLLKIFWDKLNPAKKRLTQCKRCQNYGHTASNCQRPYRCVKCLDPNHKWGECSRKSRDDQVACVLCGLTGHPANSTKCMKYIEHLNKVSSQKKHQAPRHFISTPAPWHQEPEGRPPFSVGNNNFPPLPRSQRPSASTSVSQRLIEKESDVIHPTYSRFNGVNSQAPREENFFAEFSRINEEVGEIPNLSNVLVMYRDLLLKLKQAKNEYERVMVLVAFQSSC